MAHSHRERNHQGLGNALIEGTPKAGGRVYRQQRLGGPVDRRVKPGRYHLIRAVYSDMD